MKCEITRRSLLLAAGAAPLALHGWQARGADGLPSDERPPASAAEALERLKAGNRRFVEGRPLHLHEASDWRRPVATAQRPFATILGCSDSRVPVELVFDQGFGASPFSH